MIGFVFWLICFTIVQIAGSKFEDIDLFEGEFAEYDEKGECTVTVYIEFVLQSM